MTAAVIRLNEHRDTDIFLKIISLILEITSNYNNGGKRVTPDIIYNTIVNNPRLKEYWAVLTKVGLLEYEVTTPTFKTTEKGLRFLEVFNKLDQLSREERQEEEEQQKKKKKNNNNSSSIA